MKTRRLLTVSWQMDWDTIQLQAAMIRGMTSSKMKAALRMRNKLYYRIPPPSAEASTWLASR
jgi:hypothetical protein